MAETKTSIDLIYGQLMHEEEARKKAEEAVRDSVTPDDAQEPEPNVKKEPDKTVQKEPIDDGNGKEPEETNESNDGEQEGDAE